MRSNAFYEIAGQISDALEREQRIKEEIADLEQTLKEHGGVSVLECRAVKRVLKARAKGPDALKNLADKQDADAIIYDELANRFFDTKKLYEPHDPDTGEINETESARTAADVAPERAAGNGGVVPTPRDEAKVRDSLSKNTPPAAFHAGERGASNRTSQDEAPPQAGGDTPQDSTANSGASPQSANDIIPDEMPPICNRRGEAAE